MRTLVCVCAARPAGELRSRFLREQYVGADAAAPSGEESAPTRPRPGSAAWFRTKPVPQEGPGGRRVYDLLDFNRVPTFLSSKKANQLQYNKRADTFGRDWKAKELRLKSDSDLEKLWAVLAMERTRLMGELTLLGGAEFNTPPTREARDVRRTAGAKHAAVKKSMGRIKLVLHERAALLEDPVERSRRLLQINRKAH